MKFKIGYLYTQAYSFDRDGKHFSGDTLHCVFHRCDDDGTILKTFDYKVAPSFADEICEGFCGAPRFDSFGRVVDVAALPF